MYPGLRYADKKVKISIQNFFSENFRLSTEFDLRLKKNEKKFNLGKLFVVAIKKILVIQFSIVEIV